MPHVDPFEHPEDQEFSPNLSTLDEKKGIGRASIVTVRTPFGRTIATGITPSNLGSLLRASADGENDAYQTLALEMEERDPHYYAVLQSRKLAVTSLDHMVDAVSDEPADVALAERVRELTKRADFSELLFNLLDGLGKGYSVVELMWETTGDVWTPNYAWRDQRFFMWDDVTGDHLRVLSDDHQSFGEPLMPYRWIVHRPQLRSGIGARSGLARVVAALYLLKSYALKDWMALAEVFGLPIIVGEYDNGASEEDKATLRAAVAALGSDARATINNMMKITTIEHGAGGQGAGDMFKSLTSYIDKQTSKAVLTQTMTTDDGSSLGQAKVHMVGKQEVRDADSRQLEATINRDLIVPWVDLNFGARQPGTYPFFRIMTDQPEDLAAWSRALVPMIAQGLNVEASIIRDRFGIPEPAEGAELVEGGQGMGPGRPQTRDEDDFEDAREDAEE